MQAEGTWIGILFIVRNTIRSSSRYYYYHYCYCYFLAFESVSFSCPLFSIGSALTMVQTQVDRGIRMRLSYFTTTLFGKRNTGDSAPNTRDMGTEHSVPAGVSLPCENCDSVNAANA